MQSILKQLDNDNLTEKQIYKIISKTNRRDVLLNVMETYPENTKLIMTIAKWKLTMSDYEYAKKNLNQEIVSKFKDMILDKISSIGDSDCEAIRMVFGEHHNVTKCAEDAIYNLRAALEQCNTRTGEYDYMVEEYITGTIAGARSIAESFDEYNPNNEHVYIAGDMLEELIDNNPDPGKTTLFYIYEVAKRIDPENLGDSLELALVNIPNEHKLHKLIAEKQEEDVKDYIEYIEKNYPDRLDLLEILKKKL